MNAPDPAFLAIVSADADEQDRIHQQERLARHTPVLMVAEAAMVPDAPEPSCSPAPEATMPPLASSAGAPRVGPPEAPDHAHLGLAAREAASPDDDPAGRSSLSRPAGESEWTLCPECDGAGVIYFNPSRRCPPDPQLADDRPCHVCGGTGAIRTDDEAPAPLTRPGA